MSTPTPTWARNPPAKWHLWQPGGVYTECRSRVNYNSTDFEVSHEVPYDDRCKRCDQIHQASRSDAS